MRSRQQPEDKWPESASVMVVRWTFDGRRDLFMEQLRSILTRRYRLWPPWETTNSSIEHPPNNEDRLYEECRMRPFTAFDIETRYGTLSLRTAPGIRRYPIAESARLSLLTQLQNLNSFRKHHKSHGWICCSTLDNKLLLINLRYAKSIELIGDDVEAMPVYYPAEVYRALYDLEIGDAPENLRQDCEAIIADIGEDKAMRMVSFVRVTYDQGEDEWNFLDEVAASIFYGMKAAAIFQVPPHTFTEIESEGYYRARYANLDHVAVMEIPSDRYHRLTRTRGTPSGPFGAAGLRSPLLPGMVRCAECARSRWR